MPQLPDHDHCCGCAACVDSCPRGALSLEEDQDGFYHIQVRQEQCVECHRCEKQCHLLHPELLSRSDARQVQPLAGWSTREELIRNSASGGAFAQLAYDMLQQGDTYVYGAALQSDSTVRHIEIHSAEELPQLQNAKYQQSNPVGIYNKVRERLKDGSRVLFSGVPCQVAALKAFLVAGVSEERAEQLTRNLYTAEVICHGVPTCELHRQALVLEKARRIICYRTKEGTGWIGNNNRLTYEMLDGRQIAKRKHVYDFLFRSYLQFSYCRPNCFQCPYASLGRVSDLTLGDFWGWNKSPRREEYRNHMGISVILPNTDKGRELVAQSRELHTVPAEWREIFPLNQNLYMPTNHYTWQGYRHIHNIRRLPLFLQRYIYQNGFSNRYLNEAYRRLFELVTFVKIRRENREQIQKMNEALAYLEQTGTDRAKTRE